MAQITNPKMSEEDHSLLMKPINLGLSGVRGVLRSVHDGTAEVRDLIMNECDLIIECKMCKNFYRSMDSFLDHKSMHCTGHCGESTMLYSDTQINLKLTPIEGCSVAVLQTLVPPGIAPEDVEVVVPQVFERPKAKTTDSTLVEQPQKEAIPPAVVENPIPKKVSSEAAAKHYSCPECGSGFSSMKSMRSHCKKFHSGFRAYYSCPCCESCYSNVYSVNRHLMKGHQKSKEQVSRLRSKIKKSAQMKHVEEENSEPKSSRGSTEHSAESSVIDGSLKRDMLDSISDNFQQVARTCGDRIKAKTLMEIGNQN